MGNAGFLFGFQVSGQVQEAGDLLRGKIKEFQETLAFQGKHGITSY